jgi:uncharacterized protein
VRNLKVVFATDFHGSEVCFRKTFNLAERAKADVVVLGGDWTGKALLPIVRGGGTGDGGTGGYRAELLGQTVTPQSEAELLELERRTRFNGFYPFRCEQDEYEAMLASEELRDEVFKREMVRSVERWLEIAEQKLAGTGRVCVSLPGNDDEWAIDEALNGSTRVQNSDQRLIDVGDELQLLGFGASNRTPWDTPRELDEQQIYERLTALAGDATRPLIANIHVPPYRSTLDNAPRLTDDLQIVKQAGVPVMIPVGSTAVRRFLEEAQPCVGLHGHIHESRSHARLGNTLVVNPGSTYSTGVLQAVVVTIDLNKQRVRGHQFVSG